MLTCIGRKVRRDAICVEADIWGAGSTEEFAVTTSASGEPIISTMIPDGSDITVPPILPRTGGLTAYQLWQVQKERKAIRDLYLEHWNNTVASTGTGRPVDAIICPAAPYAAPPHGHNRSVVLVGNFILLPMNAAARYGSYTTVWNALDYTASIFPVTTVDLAIDVKQPRKSFINDVDRAIYEMCMPWFLRPLVSC